MSTALSREKFKPDGSKMYVQNLIWEQREAIAKDILENKAYIYSAYRWALRARFG